MPIFKPFRGIRPCSEYIDCFPTHPLSNYTQKEILDNEDIRKKIEDYMNNLEKKQKNNYSKEKENSTKESKEKEEI